MTVQINGTTGITTPGLANTGNQSVAGNEVVSGSLSVGGGILNPLLQGTQETHVDMAANNIDCSAGNVFSKTITGVTTFTVSNVPASGKSYSFILRLTNGGSAVITWFAGVKQAGGGAITLTASGRDRLLFMTEDGGTNWDVTVAKGFAA